MKKLHVLFLASWYPSRVLKTNGDFIQRHAEAVALKHNVTVLHVITDDNLSEKIAIDDTVINSVRTLIAYIKKTKNPILKWIQFIKAYQLLIKKVAPFDVVHVNKFYPVGYFAFRLKRKKNIPYIISEHHSIYRKPYNKKIGFIEKFISKVIVKNAHTVCPVSDDLGKAMQDFGLRGNYFKVPNVVDTHRFKAKEKKNDTFTILHVSNMAKIKNIDGILRVIKQLETKITDFKFYMIGGNAANYKTNAVKLGINLNNISFINQVPHHEIPVYFQKVSIFVLFSDTENLPCVILESFSCGTPVISTDVGGISEYFPKDFGILIPSKNEKKLLNAILESYNKSNANTQEMHQYVVNNFSKEQIANTFSKLYYKSLSL